MSDLFDLGIHSLNPLHCFQQVECTIFQTLNPAFDELALINSVGAFIPSDTSGV